MLHTSAMMHGSGRDHKAQMVDVFNIDQTIIIPTCQNTRK